MELEAFSHRDPEPRSTGNGALRGGTTGSPTGTQDGRTETSGTVCTCVHGGRYSPCGGSSATTKSPPSRMENSMRTRSARSATGALGLGVALIATLLVSPTATTSATAATATNSPDFTANVMAPLEVSDWNQFGSQLSTVKSYGVDAVTVDVWWGKVEGAGDNQFNWTYYDQVFQAITSRGLDIVPIFSFHQCGGNVGDTCSIPLPSWLWGKYASTTYNCITLGTNGLKHRSEQGNVSNETVQGWA